MKVEEMKAWFPIADAARNAALREDQNDQMGALADAIAAVAPLIRRAALEEAAEHLMDTAPYDEWISAAAAIRALDT